MIRKTLSVAIAAGGLVGLAGNKAEATLSCFGFSALNPTCTAATIDFPSGGTSITELEGILAFSEAGAGGTHLLGSTTYTLSSVSMLFTSLGSNIATLYNTSGAGTTLIGSGDSFIKFNLGFTVSGGITTIGGDALNVALAGISPVTTQTVTGGTTSVIGSGASGNTVAGTPVTSSTQSSTGVALTTGGVLSGVPLSLFWGVGSESVDLSTKTNFTLDATGGNGNGGLFVTTFAQGILSVVYTYAPLTTTVPEPMTAALLGSALLGFGVVRRRLGR